MTKFTKKELVWLAKLFHQELVGGQPDFDGYLGNSTVPEIIMKVYRKNYGKARNWY